MAKKSKAKKSTATSTATGPCNPAPASGSNAAFHIALRRQRDQSLMLKRNFAARVPMTVADLVAVEEGRVAATGALYDAAVALWPTLGRFPRPADPQQQNYPDAPEVTAFMEDIEQLWALCRQLHMQTANRERVFRIVEECVRGAYPRPLIRKLLGLD